MARTLLERLRKREPGTAASRGVLTSQAAVHELQRSICANLERILNSRQGMSLACPSYGLPDLAEIILGIPDHTRNVEGAIARSIAEFEPRLADIEVTHVADPDQPLSARFRITARCVAGKRDEDVWFETVVASSGRVQLRGG